MYFKKKIPAGQEFRHFREKSLLCFQSFSVLRNRAVAFHGSLVGPPWSQPQLPWGPPCVSFPPPPRADLLHRDLLVEPPLRASISSDSEKCLKGWGKEKNKPREKRDRENSPWRSTGGLTGMASPRLCCSSYSRSILLIRTQTPSWLLSCVNSKDRNTSGQGRCCSTNCCSSLGRGITGYCLSNA